MQHRGVSVHSTLHISFHLHLNAKWHSEVCLLWRNPGKPWRKNENLKPDFSSKLVQTRLFDWNITRKTNGYMHLRCHCKHLGAKAEDWNLPFNLTDNPYHLLVSGTERQTERACRIRFFKDKSINLETDMYQHWKHAGITQTSMQGLVPAAEKKLDKSLAILHFTVSYEQWDWVCLALPTI